MVLPERENRIRLAGVIVGVGLAVVISGCSSEDVDDNDNDIIAVCTDSDGIVVDDQYCDDNYVNSHQGFYSGGFIFVGGNSYRYNYGGTGAVGSKIQGGRYEKPPQVNAKTKSGVPIQRGGFGVPSSPKPSSGGSANAVKSPSSAKSGKSR
jgi:hypothetical protein